MVVDTKMNINLKWPSRAQFIDIVDAELAFSRNVVPRLPVAVNQIPWWLTARARLESPGSLR